MRLFAIAIIGSLLLIGCAPVHHLFSSSTMTISSPAFRQNDRIPATYACDGENVSPPLHFGDVPEGAQSLALIVNDPDASRGDWVHWVVYGIDPSTTDIPKGTIPIGGIEGITDYRRTGYSGPCPPSGTHRYVFRLYAMGRDLDFDSPPTKQELLQAMGGDILASSELVGLYTRE